VVVLTDFSLLVDEFLEFGVFVLVQQPLENCFLDLLIVLILKEFVGEEAHRADNEQFSTVLSFVESADWLVRREADWST
jgi:hypothetical protein